MGTVVARATHVLLAQHATSAIQPTTTTHILSVSQMTVLQWRGAAMGTPTLWLALQAAALASASHSTMVPAASGAEQATVATQPVLKTARTQPSRASHMALLFGSRQTGPASAAALEDTPVLAVLRVQLGSFPAAVDPVSITVHT